MIVRRLLIVLFLLAGYAASGWSPAAAQEALPPVDVVELSGPIDRRLVGFAVDAIESSDAQLVILQVDSPGAVDGDIEELLALVSDPPVPVAVWVGPAPARAYGAALQLLAAADLRGAAPGAVVGYIAPTFAGESDDPTPVLDRFPNLPEEAFLEFEVTGTVPGLIDFVSPAIGQVVVGFDGVGVAAGGTTTTLATARTEVEDGVEVTKPAAEVTFIKPGLVDRTLRIAVSPEAAFFLLVAALAFAVFEFYAIGPGVAAGVALAGLLLAGYGMAVLPTNWWAVAATLAGLMLYTMDFQRNDLGWRSLLGTGALLYGGLRFVEAGPQITVLWWPIVLVVLGAALFFGIGMTTVVRARFATATIGREHLIGESGVAASDLAPDGVVLVGDARWRARSARTAGIGEGDSITVTGVDGIVLEVEPASIESS